MTSRYSDFGASPRMPVVGWAPPHSQGGADEATQPLVVLAHRRA